MFESRKDLKDRLEAAEAEANRLEDELKAHEERAEGFTALAQELAEVREDLTAATDQITGLTSELDTAKSDLEAEKEKTTEEAINALVTAKLAEAGHPGIQTFEQEEGDTLSKFEQYQKLKKTNPAEAGAFWNKNEADIKAGR